MGNFIIGIAEQKVAKTPDKIVTLGLGSCIGLILYDPVYKLGGMVHIMLPSAPNKTGPLNKAKFADTAIRELVQTMVQVGAKRQHLKAKMAGGANMFNIANKTNMLNVGQRNIEMCRYQLQKNAIPIVSEDVGGSFGRSIEFCCESSMLQVRTVNPKSVRYI